MRRRASPILRLVALIAACGVCIAQARAAADPLYPRKLQLEAAFFRKFLSYVSWPGSQRDGTPLLCVLGETPFYEILTQLVRQDADGHPVRKISNAEEGRECALLYIGSPADVEPLLETLSGTGVITVSNIDEFADRGGMIQFVIEGEHVRFIINQAAAEREGVQISSQLLALSRRTVR